MYKATTHDIEIRVRTEYVEEQSAPENHHYVWAYHITIANRRNNAVQLLNRHWVITSDNGIIEEVHGPGVIGKQPIIESNSEFSYSSGTHLSTTSGMMKGEYEMVDITSGDSFQITIPAFSLDIPGRKVSLH